MVGVRYVIVRLARKLFLCVLLKLHFRAYLMFVVSATLTFVVRMFVVGGIALVSLGTIDG